MWYGADSKYYGEFPIVLGALAFGRVLVHGKMEPEGRRGTFMGVSHWHKGVILRAIDIPHAPREYICRDLHWDNNFFPFRGMRAKLSDELMYVPDGDTKTLAEPFSVVSAPVVHSDTIAEFPLHSSNVVEQRQHWGSAMSASDFKQAAPYEGIQRVLPRLSTLPPWNFASGTTISGTIPFTFNHS